jgi:hypothetical protein
MIWIIYDMIHILPLNRTDFSMFLRASKTFGVGADEHAHVRPQIRAITRA